MIPLFNPFLQSVPLDMEIQKHHILWFIQLVPGPDII